MLLCLRWPALLAIAVLHARPRKPRRINSILLIRLDGLGDCILTLPLIESLRRRFPTAHLSVLTTPVAAPLFEAVPEVDEVLMMGPALTPVWPKYLRGLLGALRAYWRHLRGRRIDIAILPRWDADIYHGTLLCALTRSPIRIGYADGTTAYKMRTCVGFQRAWTTVLPPGPLQHEARRALQTATVLGCDTSDAHPHLPLTDAHHDAGRAWLEASLPGWTRSHALIAVGLPAAEAKKRWPASLYLEALQSVAGQRSAAFVFFADTATAEAADVLNAAFPVSCVAQQLPLLLAAAVLAECAAFAGVDSGLGHLAAAAGCPTVTLFAQAGDCSDHTGWHSNSPERFRPLSARGAMLLPARARSGCGGGCSRSEPHCILDIAPEDVASAVLALLPPARITKPAEADGYNSDLAHTAQIVS